MLRLLPRAGVRSRSRSPITLSPPMLSRAADSGWTVETYRGTASSGVVSELSWTSRAGTRIASARPGLGSILLRQLLPALYMVLTHTQEHSNLRASSGGRDLWSAQRFPSPVAADSSANGLALKKGRGINIPLTQRIGWRVIEANWLRTQLPNSVANVQNNLQLGAGFTLNLNSRR